MSRLSLLVLTTLALVGLSSHSAEAKRHKKSKKAATACGISYLPFTAGTTWKYVYVVPPGVESQPGQLKAKDPDDFTIKVESVDSEGDGATIKLSESFRKVTRQTTLRCTKTALEVPIDSFFFAGELPGAIGITLGEVNTKGDTYPGAQGLKRGDVTFIELKTEIVRDPVGGAEVVHPKAKLELERQITVGRSDDIEVEHGIHKATPVEVAISGRTTLEPSPDKEVPLPDGTAMLWFSNDLGLIRAYNRLGEGWELAEMTDPDGKPVE